MCVCVCEGDSDNITHTHTRNLLKRKSKFANLGKGFFS